MKEIFLAATPSFISPSKYCSLSFQFLPSTLPEPEDRQLKGAFYVPGV